MRISELENRLRKHAETTKSVLHTPFELSEEIKNMEVNAMRKAKSEIAIKRILVIAVVLAVLIITVTITPFANTIKGFFSDITRFDGAVTGTKYENSTNEIDVEISEISSKSEMVVTLDLTFKNPKGAPFAYIDEVAVAEYKIFDSDNNEIVKIKYSEGDGEKGTVCDGKVMIDLTLNDTQFIQGEEYTIVIEKFYGLAKADAPLHITGSWKCNFKR